MRRKAKPLVILAVAAHPDDVEFGIGAILVLQYLLGAKIHILILSRGEGGTNGNGKIREQEARAAARFVNAEVQFLNCTDSEIEYSREVAFRIAEVIREVKPDIVLAPTLWEDQHPDHYEAGRMTRDACRFARYAGVSKLKKFAAHTVRTLLHYAATPHLPTRPDVILDVTAHVKIWKQMMRAHKSQKGTRNYEKLFLTMASLWGQVIGTEYGWGLWKNDPLVITDLSAIERTQPVF